MKETELRSMAKCGICDKPILQTGIPIFWKLKMQRFGICELCFQKMISLDSSGNKGRGLLHLLPDGKSDD